MTPLDPDTGHDQLINDLTEVLVKVELFKYHDFHENGFATPKKQLVSDLQALITLVKAGAYDN